VFGIDSSEFLLIGIVALIVIGPKDLPRVMRLVGGWVGRGRAMTRHLRAGFDTMMREAELEEMQKQWARQNAEIMAATAPAAVAPHSYDAAVDPHAGDAVIGPHRYDHPGALPPDRHPRESGDPSPTVREETAALGSERPPGVQEMGPRVRGDDRGRGDDAAGKTMIGPSPAPHALAAAPPALAATPPARVAGDTGEPHDRSQ